MKKVGGLRFAVWVALVIAHWSGVTGVAEAQSVRSLVNSGNDLYASKKFGDAEVNYKKAIEKDITSVPGHFNLGNSLYRQDKYDESVKSFHDAIGKADGKTAKALAYFNLGNAQLKSQKYDEAVKAFTESLKLNPDDADAKYNLSYALLKQKEQQQKNQNKNDKNQDKNKDKQDQDKQNQDQNKQDQQQQDQQKQDQQNQQQQNQDQQQAKQDQTRQQEKQMSKADAERILDVLKNNEKDVQKKIRQRVAGRPRGEKDW